MTPGEATSALRAVLDEDRPAGVRLHRTGEAVLCAVDLDRVCPDAGAERVLTADERRRLRALPVAKRRREWLGGRIAAKRAVQAWSDGRLGPLDVRIEPDGDGPTRGRPRVRADGPAPHIGITHSGRWALALAAPRPVGIDIERIRRFPEALSRSAFSADERARIARSPLPAPVATALWWTCKEALLKAIGRGIHGYLRAVEIVDWQAGAFAWRAAETLDGADELARACEPAGIPCGDYAATITVAP